MGVFAEYRTLYDKYIVEKAKLLIVKYDSQKHNYEYKPYSHATNDDALEGLSNLIIDNMAFYAFSEDEIVALHERYGMLEDLKIAAKYAYTQRLPKRKNADTDGTPGEVLLDLLIQVYEPLSQKLIARAKYKQLGDNNEIKGYDALYFTKNTDDISLWLGQVKTGTRSYCKTDIVSDLNNKYLLDYFAKSVYYIADKNDNCNDLSSILNEINDLCYKSIKNNWSDDEKKEALLELLTEKQIKIKIPCLLAYTANIYKDRNKLDDKIEKSVNRLVKEFDDSNYLIAKGLNYEIMFYIFPIKDVNKLRSKIVEFKKAGR